MIGPSRMLMPLQTPGSNSNILALADGAWEFSLPGALRQSLTKHVADRLFATLPIALLPPAPAGARPRGREDYLRLADQSRAALGALGREFQAYVEAVVRAGIRVHVNVPQWHREVQTNHVMQGLASHIPGVPVQEIRPLPLEALTAADAEVVHHHFREAAWAACLQTAGHCLDAVEKLFHMMAVGLVQFVGGDGARVFFCRGPLKRATKKGGPHCPSTEASHPFFEHADCAVARVTESINVARADHGGIWAKTPPRIRNMLAATPRWLHADVYGITATAVRVGDGVVDPARMRAYSTDGVAYLKFSAVILFDQFVLAAWDEDETPSLLKWLFGIG